MRDRELADVLGPEKSYSATQVGAVVVGAVAVLGLIGAIIAYVDADTDAESAAALATGLGALLLGLFAAAVDVLVSIYRELRKANLSLLVLLDDDEDEAVASGATKRKLR